MPDSVFVAALRETVERYLAAVDQWEAAYQKYYRLPGYRARIGDDLEAEYEVYEGRRRELEAMLPRARRLCLRYGMPEPFSGLLRISLGRYSPQERMDSTIGRNERSVVAKRLVELADACREWELPAEAKREKESILRRIAGFFY
jgi:hypothetical protein